MERGLIIKKEWLDRIFDGGKVWEMRSRPTNITGRIGLIQSGSGLIVGEVTLVGWIKLDLSTMDACNNLHQIEDIKLLERWPYAWVLEDAKRYENPMPYTHPQGAVIWVKLNQSGEEKP